MKTKKQKPVDTSCEKEDEHWMRLAIELAMLGEGMTRPNPPVGAVVMKNGHLVASGYHRRAGLEHAERVALRRAGNKACGATLYISLEPCSTYGRTPPCTDRIIESGVKRVVIAACDPNPRHNGKGIAILRRAGITVDVGICRKDAENILAPFTRWILEKRPLVSLKLAVTADGKIADRTGASQWITGPESRKYVQQLRRKADAVMVGINTVIADNPRLIPRPAYGRKNWRVVVDSHARIPLTAQIINDEHTSRTLLAVTEEADEEKLQQLERRGVMLLRCTISYGRVDLHDLLKKLGEMGLLHVICEGGGCLAGALVRESLADRLFLFIAPSFLGSSGIHALGETDWSIDHQPVFDWEGFQRIGKDVLLISRIKQRRNRNV